MIRLPAIRAGRSFRRDPLPFLRERDDGSDLLRFRAGTTDFAVVRRPESIHRVLVADAASYGEGKWTLRGNRVMSDCLITREGEAHGERRAALQPGFDRAHLEHAAPAIVARAQRLSDSWREGETIEARAAMGRVALCASAEALFGLELDEHAEAMLPSLQTMLGEIPRPGLPWPASRRLAAARRVIEPIVDEAIATRRAGEPGGDDVLGRMLWGGENGDRLGEAAIRDELISLLIASIDTTPGTLAWAWLLIARHPEVEAALHAELDSKLGERPARYEDLPELELLDAVLTEVLRLYPPVHFVDRRPLHDVELDGCRLERDSFMLISPLFTHRDPRFYERPDEFDLGRWSRQERSSRPRYTYFPFGGGPHTCIGMTLARMELALVIATLARRWRLQPLPELPADPSPQTSCFPMRVVAR